MATNKIQDILNQASVDGNLTPSYTISTSPWTVGSTTGATYSNVTWTSPNTWTTSDTFTIASPHTKINQGGKIQLEGENADIEINGESLVAMLRQIQQRMNILTVNTELEAEWEELRELGDQYRALEQHIIEKMKTWKKLQAQDNDNR